MTEEEIREVKSRLAVEVDQTDERDTNDCTNGDAQRRIHAVRGDHRGSGIPDKALLTAFVDSPGVKGAHSDTVVPPMTRYTKSQFVSAGPGAAALFCPVHPGRLLVLAHGFPWPDGSQSDSALAEYAFAVVERWKPFAEDHGALIVAPVFGGRSFSRY